METKLFTKQNIIDFVESDTYRALDNVPISKSRAYSQANNPRADAEDLLLVAQFDGTKTAGYLGVLPDYVVVNGEKRKMGWLTCFWVDDAYKSKNVAANLFLRVIRAWKKNIFITNIVPWLEPVYQKTKMFQPTKYKTGIRLYLRFNFADILPPKHSFFETAKPALRLTDQVLNSVLSVRNLWTGKSRNITCREFSNFDDVPANLLATTTANWPVRGKNEFDWLCAYPWVSQGKPTGESKKYYFTSQSARFWQRIFTISDPNNQATPKAAAMITIRDNHLTVPYCFCQSNDFFPQLASTIISIATEKRVSMITVFHPELALALAKQKKHVLFSKKVTKPYFISINFPEVTDLHFQDGDGDCAFY